MRSVYQTVNDGYESVVAYQCAANSTLIIPLFEIDARANHLRPGSVGQLCRKKAFRRTLPEYRQAVPHHLRDSSPREAYRLEGCALHLRLAHLTVD